MRVGQLTDRFARATFLERSHPIQKVHLCPRPKLRMCVIVFVGVGICQVYTCTNTAASGETILTATLAFVQFSCSFPSLIHSLTLTHMYHEAKGHSAPQNEDYADHSKLRWSYYNVPKSNCIHSHTQIRKEVQKSQSDIAPSGHGPDVKTTTLK